MKSVLKIMLLAVTAGMLLTFASCEVIVSFIDNDDSSGTVRVFSAQTYNGASEGTWYNVTSDLLVKGEYCDVYVERGNSVTQATAEAVAAEFDDNIFNQITDAFGAHRDVDDNGKVILLLLDIKDGYDPDVGGGYVTGYFDPAHMFATESNPHSNECDMIFVDVDPVIVKSEEFYTTIAHEFQHLINFSITYGDNQTLQDLWINEGLSSGAEYVYNRKASQMRIDHFNNDSNKTIARGNNFFVWYGYWEDEYSNTVLDNYATVSLFFQWLRIHASNGTAIYKEILASDFRDYRAVTAAAGSKIDPVYGEWDRLLETWYLANFRCQDTGYYGYKGEIETSPIGWTSQDDYEYQLEAGEGVISALSETAGDVATWTPPDGSGDNIQYAGFNSDGTGVDRIPEFDNEYALVLNANTDNTPKQFEDCFVANVAVAPGDNPVARSMQARIDANKKPLPKKFPIGFHPGYSGSGETPEQKLLKNKAGFAPRNMKQGRKGL